LFDIFLGAEPVGGAVESTSYCLAAAILRTTCMCPSMIWQKESH